MQVSINNFKGIKEVEFEIGDVTVIAGDNGAGKTSIAQAVACALTGECPVRDMKKQDYRYFVNNSQSEIGTTAVASNCPTASVKVCSDKGSCSMSYPDGKGFSTGVVPRASVFATGITSPLDFKRSDMVDCWVKILQSEPTMDDLREALEGENPPCPPLKRGNR